MSRLEYGELERELRNAPVTWLPALLAIIVEEVVRRSIFLDNGLVRYVERVQKLTKERGL